MAADDDSTLIGFFDFGIVARDFAVDAGDVFVVVSFPLVAFNASSLGFFIMFAVSLFSCSLLDRKESTIFEGGVFGVVNIKSVVQI